MGPTSASSERQASQTAKLPLARFKVVDLTRARAGPTAVRQLADWGAQVTKVEATGKVRGLGGAWLGPDYQNLHRNKRSIGVDLKSPQGLAVLHRLVKDADVVVENFRPDVKHRLKVDYESLKKINPRIVYASISGFGQTGPYAGRPGVDQIAQGMGGLMSITGERGRGPMRVGIPIDDLCAGMFCAIGILVALLEREESGEGQWVHTSLLEAQIAMLDFQATRWLMKKDVPQQVGNDHPTNVPTGVFKTADGTMNIAASHDLFFRLRDALGDESLKHEDFATDELRYKNRDRLHDLIERTIETKTSAEWVEVLNKAGVPAGPIYRVDEVFADPQVSHLDMEWKIAHPILGEVTLVRNPVTLSRTPAALRSPTPDRGEHTQEVMTEAGYDEEEIDALRAGGAIM